MARDSSLYVRQAFVAMLKAAPEITVLVPAEQVYPPQRPANPPWPFIGVGVPIAAPAVASCMDGSRITLAVHGYAATTGEGDETVPGEDMASSIIRTVVAVMGGEDGAEIPLDAARGGVTDCPYPATAYVVWTGSQVIQDGAEADSFHGIASFDITVSS